MKCLLEIFQQDLQFTIIPEQQRGHKAALKDLDYELKSKEYVLKLNCLFSFGNKDLGKSN